MKKEFFSDKNIFQLRSSCLQRKWNHIHSRESLKSIKTHGQFLGNFIWISCRSSIYILWKYKIGKLGKGNLSRWEPFYFSPNPCFNSIGRAGRENRAHKNILDNGWEYESLQLNLVETSFLLKCEKLKIISVKNSEYANKIFSKIDSKFNWNLIIFKKYLFSELLLRSGAKYGGNFVLYKNENIKEFHSHSKAIATVEIPWLIENSCIKCMRNGHLNFLIVQNKTRLAQQVSKIIIYISFFLKYKKQYRYLANKWILIELALQRWIPNI
nr:26S proteasome AAA-ATPase subunit [Cryptomonas sp.]